MIAYFKCSAENYKNHIMFAMPDNDILPVDVSYLATNINRRPESTYPICNVKLTPMQYALLQQETGVENPLTKEAMTSIDLGDIFLGTTIEDVYANCDVPATYTYQDEDGSDITVPFLVDTLRP